MASRLVQDCPCCLCFRLAPAMVGEVGRPCHEGPALRLRSANNFQAPLVTVVCKNTFLHFPGAKVRLPKRSSSAPPRASASSPGRAAVMCGPARAQTLVKADSSSKGSEAPHDEPGDAVALPCDRTEGQPCAARPDCQGQGGELAWHPILCRPGSAHPLCCCGPGSPQAGAGAWSPRSGQELAAHVLWASSKAVGPASGWAACVYPIQEHRGWSLIVRLEEGRLGLVPAVLQAVQREVLRAVAELPCARLLGPVEAPFKPKLRGFSAALALFLPGAKTDPCWDMVTTGCCQRGRSCRWQHPVGKQRLNVAVRLLAEPAA